MGIEDTAALGMNVAACPARSPNRMLAAKEKLEGLVVATCLVRDMRSTSQLPLISQTPNLQVVETSAHVWTSRSPTD